MRRPTEVAALPAALCLFFAVFVFPASPEGGSLIPSVSPMAGPVDVGVIFNTDDLLLGLQSYQAGLGAKIGWGDLCLRGLLDFAVNGSSQSFAVSIGAVGEYHLAPGPVSPYLGAFAGGGYMIQGGVESVITFSLGLIAGVEVFIFDFLSVFAEYAIEADFADTIGLQNMQSAFDYLVTTRMGNKAMLGVVIYIMRSEPKTE